MWKVLVRKQSDMSVWYWTQLTESGNHKHHVLLWCCTAMHLRAGAVLNTVVDVFKCMRGEKLVPIRFDFRCSCPIKENAWCKRISIMEKKTWSLVGENGVHNVLTQHNVLSMLWFSQTLCSTFILAFFRSCSRDLLHCPENIFSTLFLQHHQDASS